MSAPTKVALVGLAGLFALPFVIPVHTLPIPSFYKEWWAILCGLLMITPWVFSKKQIQVTLPRIAWLPISLGVLILIQMAFGRMIYPSQGGLALFYLLWALMLMAATRMLVDEFGREKIMATLAWAVVVGGVLNAIIGVFQAFDIHTPVLEGLISYSLSKGVVFGNITQANQYADYLSLSLAAVVFLGYKQRHLWPLFSGLGLVILLGLVLSGSRAVWLYLLALLLLGFAFHSKRPSSQTRYLVVLLVLVLVVFQLMQMILGDGGASHTANNRIQGEIFQHRSVRFALWQDAFAMFVSSPWLGVGFQNYAWQHFELLMKGQSHFVGLGASESIQWNNAHNILLHLAAEFGILALLLLVIACWWLFRVLRNVDSIDKWWLSAGLAMISIHSLLEYPLWYAPFLGVFFVLVALSDDDLLAFDVPMQNLRRMSLFVAICGVGILAFYYSTYIALERATMYFTANSRTEAMTAQFQKDFNHAQLNPFLDPLVDTLLSDMPPVDMDLPDVAGYRLRLNEKVMRQRGNADVVYQRVTLLWAAGRQQDAEKWLAIAGKVYPKWREKYVEHIEQSSKTLPVLVPLLDFLKVNSKV